MCAGISVSEADILCHARTYVAVIEELPTGELVVAAACASEVCTSGSDGITIQHTRYATIPVPPKIATSSQITRISETSRSKYSANASSTPAILRPVRVRNNCLRVGAVPTLLLQCTQIVASSGITLPQ